MLIIRNIFLSLLISSFILGLDDPLIDNHLALLSLFSDMDANIYNNSKAIEYIEDNNLKNDFFKLLNIFNTKLSRSLNDPNFILKSEDYELQLLKSDSRYFTELNKNLKIQEKSKIIKTFSFEEDTEVWSESNMKTPFDYFIENFIISFTVGNSINYPIGSNQVNYKNGYDLGLTTYHPDKISIFNKDMIISFNLNNSFISVSGDDNIIITSLDLNLAHYFNTVPVFIATSASILKHTNHGLCASIGLLSGYKVKFDFFDLLVSVKYKKFIDILSNPELIFLDKDLLGITLAIKKDLILN